MSPLRKKQLAAVGALLLAGGALTFISFGGIEKNLVYYWDVAQLVDKGEAAKGAVVRLGGVVKTGTLDWNSTTLDLRFQVGMRPEPGDPSVKVVSRGAPPQMFREGIGVVLEGRYDGAVFKADRVMVKHSNEYRAPKDGERPEDLYGTLIEGSD
jgi:cytochrome c-type biogenesis protein CcmE